MTEVKAEIADFAGGCFWGVEEAFRTAPGVIKTEVGYEGGHVENPSYEQIITHTTGHAETVQVSYDPAQTDYSKLLKIFFGTHDPTTPNQDGPNIGNNYRSVIFYHNSQQQKIAEQIIEEIQPKFRRPIVTQIEAASTFWPAEEYHQKFLLKHNLGVCSS